MDLGFNLAQSNRDLKDLTSRQNFGDTSGLLCKNDLIPCLMENTKSNLSVVQWTNYIYAKEAGKQKRADQTCTRKKIILR